MLQGHSKHDSKRHQGKYAKPDIKYRGIPVKAVSLCPEELPHHDPSGQEPEQGHGSEDKGVPCKVIIGAVINRHKGIHRNRNERNVFAALILDEQIRPSLMLRPESQNQVPVFDFNRFHPDDALFLRHDLQ